MLRREFMGCAVAATVALSEGSAQQAPAKQAKLKITVLRKTLNTDLHQQYRNSPGSPCPVFQEGQEFLLESPYEPPKGFCQWAWADIRHYLQGMWGGMKYGSDVFVAACTDGFRPVLFKIERIESA
jgi:uncharacterized repeat protein (TIGR04076 family)